MDDFPSLFGDTRLASTTLPDSFVLKILSSLIPTSQAGYIAVNVPWIFMNNATSLFHKFLEHVINVHTV